MGLVAIAGRPGGRRSLALLLRARHGDRDRLGRRSPARRRRGRRRPLRVQHRRLRRPLGADDRPHRPAPAGAARRPHRPRARFGFFTIVAGTCVLGTETILIADHFAIATVLLAIAACSGSSSPTRSSPRSRSSPTSRRCRRDQRWLAAGGRRDPGDRRPDRAARRPLGTAAADARQLRRPLDVALGRDALHLDRRADLLPLHVLPVLARRSRAALLDQHGRDGDLDPGRGAADHRPRPTRRSCGRCGRSSRASWSSTGRPAPGGSR